jgi:hypothetical protein
MLRKLCAERGMQLPRLHQGEIPRAFVRVGGRGPHEDRVGGHARGCDGYQQRQVMHDQPPVLSRRTDGAGNVRWRYVRIAY